MSQAIRNAIYARLTASQGAGTLYEDVGGRIYESVPPQAATNPNITYVVTDDPLEVFHGGAASQTCNVTFVIRGSLGNQPTSGGGSTGAAAIGAIEVKLYALFHGVSLTVSGHDRGLCVCTTRGVPDVEEGSHTNTSTYVVTATTT